MKSKREIIEEDLITLEDGFYYYWIPDRKGALDAADLRLIADILDEKNKPWEDELIEHMASLPDEPLQHPFTTEE